LNTTLINTFDVVEKRLNPKLYDQLDKLKLEFVTYQRYLSNQVEEAIKNHSHEKIPAILRD